MSPPHNGRFNSSPSSTGTRPKSNSRMNGGGGSGGRNSQPPNSASQAQKFELERLLLEQQAKLRSLEQEQNSGGEFQDYREKLRLLQV